MTTATEVRLSENPKNDKLAALCLGLTRTKAREVAKQLRQVLGQCDLDEIESDANLFLCKAIGDYDSADGECRVFAGYFKQGLSSWASNYVQNAVRDFKRQREGRSRSITSVPITKGVDVGVEPVSPMEWDEQYDELVKRSGRKGQPVELRRVVKKVVEEGWSRDEIIDLVGRDRFYKTIRPALFQLAREGGVEVDCGE